MTYLSTRPCRPGLSMPQAHLQSARPRDPCTLGKVVQRCLGAAPSCGMPVPLTGRASADVPPSAQARSALREPMTLQYSREELTREMFANIHSDWLIQWPTVIDIPSIQSKRFLLKFIESRGDEAYATRLSNLFKNFEWIARSQDLHQKAQEIANRIHNLQTNERLLINGGWYDADAGHCIPCEFVKRDNGNYDIYLYNTGRGLEYHAEVATEDKTLICPFIKYADVLPAELGLIPTKEMTPSDFFYRLLELQLRPHTDHNAEDIYGRIFGHLTNKIQTTESNPALFITKQRGPTCFWSSLHAVMRAHASDVDDYKRFKFEMKFSTLIAFFQLYQEELEQDTPASAEKRYLLRTSATKLYREILRFYSEVPAQSLLPQERVDTAVTTVRDLLATLDALEIKIAQERINKQQVMTWPAEEGWTTTSLSTLNTQAVLTNPPTASVDISTSLPLELKITPTNLLSQLQQITKHLETCKEEPLTQIYQIEQLISSLPIPKPKGRAQDFWANVPPAERPQILSQLFSLLRTYSTTCFQLRQFQFPFQQNTAYRLLACAHQIALLEESEHWRDQPDRQVLSQQALTISLFENLSQDPYFVCFDSADSKIYQELVAYFSSFRKKASETIFDFPRLQQMLEWDEPLPSEGKALLQMIEGDARVQYALQEKLKEWPIFAGTNWTEDVRKMFALFSDPSLLRDSPQTAYLADLREMAFICHFFSGKGVNIPEIPFRGFFCELTITRDKIQSTYSYANTHLTAASAPDKACYHAIHHKEEVHALLTNQHYKAHRPSSRIPVVVSPFHKEPSRVTTESELYHNFPLPEEGAIHCPALLARTAAVPALQPSLVIDYFRSHLHELQETDAQTLFHIMFFKEVDKRMPIEEALKDPQFIAQCNQFISQGLDVFYHKQPGKRPHIYAGLFFVRLVQRLKQIDSTIQLVEVNEVLNEWLTKKDLEEEERSAVHLHRMMQYSIRDPSTLTAQEKGEILTSWFYFSNHHFDLVWKDPYLHAEAQRLIYRMQSVCHNLDQTKEGQHILDQIVLSCGLTPSTPGNPWKIAQPPLYTNGLLSLNMLTGRIASQEGIVCSGRQIALEQFADFRRLFGDQKFKTSQVGDVIYFTDREGHAVRVWQTSQTSCIIQRQVNNQWFQYLSPENFESIYHPLFPWPLLSDYDHWIPLDNTNMVIQLYSRQRGGVEAYVTQEGELTYRDGALVARDLPASSPLTHFNRFERTECLVIKLNEAQQLSSVSLPRFRSAAGKTLQMNLVNGQLVWEENPRFRLQTSIEPSLGNFTNYLGLEDPESRRKNVLIPVKPIKESESQAPHAELDIDDVYRKQEYQNAKKPYMVPQEGILTFFEYHICADGSIQALNTEGLLYLAYLYLAQKNYAETDRLLRQITTGTHLSSQSEKMLKWIIRHSKLSHDWNPSAAALRLRAGLILGNWYARPQEKSRSPEKLSQWLEKDYHRYLDAINNVHADFLLTTKEELRLESLQIIDTPPARFCFLSTGERPSSRPTHPSLDKLATQYRSYYYRPLEPLSIYASYKEATCADFAEQIWGGVRPKDERSIYTSFIELYQEAKRAKSFEDKLRVSTRLALAHLSKRKPMAAIRLWYVNPQALIQLVHFCLLYPDQAPELPSAQMNKEEWLLGLIACYNRAQATDRAPVMPYIPQIPTSIPATRRTHPQLLRPTRPVPFPECLRPLQLPPVPPRASNTQQLRSEIFAIAHKRSHYPRRALRETLAEEGQLSPKATLEQLITAFLKGDAHAYQRLCPQLSLQEIQILDQKIQKFLILSTEKTHAQNMGLHYDPSRERALLVYEYRSGLRIRPQQVQLLRHMLQLDPATSQYKDCIIQLMMGGGKTTVLASILLQLAATPGCLSVFIPPAAQFETLQNNLTGSQRDYFAQELRSINLQESDFTLENLLKVRDYLLEALESGQVVLIKSETLQALQLKYLNLVYQLAHQRHGTISEELQTKINCLREILNLFKERSDVLCDEVDLTLTPMHEVNLPLGSKTPVAASYIDLMREIFLLHVSEELSDIIGLRANKQHHMNTQTYQQEVIPVIARELAAYPSLLLPPDHYESFVRYVQNKPDENFLNYIAQLARSPNEEERRAADLIALSKHLFSDILPLTLGKKTKRGYGRKKGATGKVIPFLGAGRPARTEFGNPWEAAAYHFQTALSKGIHSEQILELAGQMTQRAQQTMATTTLSFDQTAAALEFEQLTGVALADIKKEGNVAKAGKAIQSNVEALLLCESETVGNCVGFYEHYLSSNAQNFVSQANTFRGFSGTPWNSSCYPESLANNTHLDSSVDQHFTSTMLERNSPIHTIQNNRIQHILTVALQQHKHPKKVCGFIDACGLFTDNEAVARDILEFYAHDSTVQAVLFFGKTSPEEDHANTLMILRKGDLLPTPIDSTAPDEELKKHGIRLEETFVFYDEAHCEATNIPQREDAINLISIDADVTQRTLFQGIGRLRGYFAGQDAEYVIHERARGRLINEGKSVKDILDSASHTQAVRKAKETYRSYKQKIDQVLRQAALDQLLQETDLRRQAALFLQYEPLLVCTTTQSPYAQFGMQEEEIPSRQALFDYCNSRYKLFNSCHNGNCSVHQKLSVILESAYHSPHLPEKVSSRHLQHAQQVNVQQQQEISMELECDLQEELDHYNIGDNAEAYVERGWSSDALAALSQSEGPLHTTAPALLASYPYQAPYAQIFDDTLLISKNLASTTQVPHAVFNTKQKVGDKILVMAFPGQPLRVMMLSVQDTAFFKTYLKQHPQNNAWLAFADGSPLSPARALTDSENAQLARALWFVNFFNGNSHYLVQHEELSQQILNEHGAELKRRFLQLKVERDLDRGRPNRALFHATPFLNGATRTQRLYSERGIEEAKLKKWIQSLEETTMLDTIEKRPGLIPLLKPQQIKSLVKSEHIAQLTSRQAPHITPEQVPHLSSAVIPFLIVPELINAVPKKLMNHLRPHQIPPLTKEKVKELPFSQLQHLAPRQIDNLSTEQLQQLPMTLLAHVPSSRQHELSDLQLTEPREKQTRDLLQNQELQERQHLERHLLEVEALDVAQHLERQHHESLERSEREILRNHRQESHIRSYANNSARYDFANDESWIRGSLEREERAARKILERYKPARP